MEGLSVKKARPDGVVRVVTERVAAASVESAEGRWLVSAPGKLLELDKGAGGENFSCSASLFRLEIDLALGYRQIQRPRHPLGQLPAVQR